MTTEREFPVGVVVTLAVGSEMDMFCSLEQLYDVFGFIVGDLPMIGQIDEFIERCRPAIEGRVPVLPPLPTADDDLAKHAWLAALPVQTITLAPLPETRRAASEKAE